MNIYFIRHGSKSKNTIINEVGYPDMELSDQGLEEVDATGKCMRSTSLDAIYSSDLIRAMQTATAILQYQKMKEFIVETRVREIHMGVFHTSTEDEVKLQHPEFYEQFVKKEIDFTYPEGECGNDVRLRVLEFLEEIITKPYKNVAVVCHGGVIRSIFSFFLGMEQSNRFKINPACGSISCVEYQDGFKVVSLNESMHLRAGGISWN